MQALLLLTGLGIALYGFKRWSDQVGPARTRVALHWLTVVGGMLLVVFLVARGATSLMWPLLMLLIPYLIRILQTSGATILRPPRGSPSQAPSSMVETRFLRMSLDHGTGEMAGEVVAGPFAGRSLAHLTQRELIALWRGCQDDPQSVAVLEAYLDRVHDDWRGWSQTGDHRAPEAGTAMSRQDALAILGLDEGASPAEIKAAHRRLMQRLHPDHGGSTYLATRVNQAKDLLLSG